MQKLIIALIILTWSAFSVSETVSVRACVDLAPRTTVMVIGVTSLAKEQSNVYDGLRGFKPDRVLVQAGCSDKKVSEIASMLAKNSKICKTVAWDGRSALPAGRVLLVVDAAILPEIRDWIVVSAGVQLQEVAAYLLDNRSKLSGKLPVTPLTLESTTLVG